MMEEQRSVRHDEKNQSVEECFQSQPMKEPNTFMRLLQAKEHDYCMLLQESIVESSAELDLKEKELALLQKSILDSRAKKHAEEQRLESIQKTLEERYAKLKQKDVQIAAIQQNLSACCQEFEAKVIEIGAIQLSIEERSRELAEKTEQLEFVKNQINERDRDLRLKQEDCNWQNEMLQKLILERDELQRRRRVEIEEYEKDFSAKKAKLCSMQSLIRESQKEMQIKNLELDLVQDEIENAREKHGAELMELSRRIVECNSELRRKEEGLEAMQKLIYGQCKEAELKRTKLLNSVGEKMKQLVLEIESYKTEFASISLLLNERISEIEKQVDGRLKELDFKEKLNESKVNEIKVKEEQLEDKARKLETKEKQIEEQVKEYKAREVLFEAAVMELKAKADQTIEQLKEFESKTMLYECRMKELESKEMRFERQVKDFESKTIQYEEQVKDLGLREAHVKVQLKKLESKEKHFEEQVKDFESRQNQLEEQVKNSKVKEMHIKEQLMELESKERLYKERMKKVDSNEKRQEGWVLKLKSKEKQVEALAKEFEQKEKEFEGQVKDLELKKKQCEEQVNELGLKEAQIKLQLKEIETKEKQCETRMKDLDLKHNQLEEQQKELDKKVKHNESLRIPLAKEKVLKENSGILFHHQSKTEQLDHKDAPPSVEKLPDKQTSEPELISDDILVNLQTSPDPAKFVLAKILTHIAPQNKMWHNGVTIDANHIFLLEQLMRISPHVKPQVREGAMKLALDLKANMSTMTGNSFVVLGFLLILTIYGLASTFVEDEVLKLFEFAAEHKQAVELFQTLGFVDKIYDFVQNLVKNQQYIEAVRFICAYKLSDKIHPVDLLRQFVHKTRRESIAQEMKAKDADISTLGSALQCISDYKLESPDLVKEIQDHIHEIQRYKVNIGQSDSDENHANNEEKKRGNEAVNNNYYQMQQYWVDQNNNKRPRTGVLCPVPQSFTPLQPQQQHVFWPLPPRGAPVPNGGVNPQYGFQQNNYYGPANTGAGQFRPNGPNNFYQNGPYPRPV